MTFQNATANYLSWLRDRVKPTPELFEFQMDEKVRKMRKGLFPFLRGTFYRWAELWPRHCPLLASRSDHLVLAVGDLHMENFGTWRDEEDHLIWGVNDFDEAHELPFTCDLVRLATSALAAAEDLGLKLSAEQASTSLLGGYRAACASGGAPFVLESERTSVRPLIQDALRSRPESEFWMGLRKEANYPPVGEAFPLPKTVEDLLTATLSADVSSLDYRAVVKAKGLGSLGRPRYLVLAQGEFGFVGREAKRIVPSAVAWLSDPATDRIEAGRLTAAQTPSRSPDPTYRVYEDWTVRALSPDAVKIELGKLGSGCTQKVLLELLTAMGKETANVHLGSESGVDLLQALADLASNDPAWLSTAAGTMLEVTAADWKEFQAAG